MEFNGNRNVQHKHSRASLPEKKIPIVGSQGAASRHATFRNRPPIVTSRIELPQSKRARHRNLMHWPFSRTFTVVLACAIVTAFSSGAWFAWQTPGTVAETPAQELANSPDASKPIPLMNTAVGSQDQSGVTNDMLFNTPLEQLRAYFESRTTVDAVTERTALLKKYLTAKKSPFESEAATIARQPHWKLILAISFAESTMGRRCYYNNCSGIGGSNIKTYSSVAEWIEDFNGLIERRYKDKTLEQMCGVYVQPCNPNWLNATQQILSELDDAHIE